MLAFCRPSRLKIAFQSVFRWAKHEKTPWEDLLLQTNKHRMTKNGWQEFQTPHFCLVQGAGRDNYYYGCDALFERHPDILQECCARLRNLHLRCAGWQRLRQFSYLSISLCIFIWCQWEPVLAKINIVGFVRSVPWHSPQSRTAVTNLLYCKWAVGRGSLRQKSSERV